MESVFAFFSFFHDTTSRAAYDTNQSLNEPADSDDVCNIIDVCYSRTVFLENLIEMY